MINNGIIVNDNKRVEVGIGGKLFTYPAPPPTDNYTPTVNTVAYWPLNADTKDHTTHGWDLVDNGTAPSIVIGKFGNGITFTGVECLYNNTPIVANGANITICMWLKAVPSPDDYSYVGAFNLGKYNNGFSFGVGGYGSHCRPVGLVNYKAWLFNASTDFTGGWDNVVYTKDTSNQYSIYLNGIRLVDNAPTSLPNDYDGSSKTLLGRQELHAGYNYYGGMCEVIIEDKIWSLTDVQNYYSPRA